MQIIKLLGLFLILFSCKDNKKIEQTNISFEKDQYEIISQLINNIIPGSMPAPPSPDFDLKDLDTIYYKKYIDSLKTLEINIALSDKFITINDIPKNLSKTLDKEFVSLLKKLENNKGNGGISRNKLSINDNYKITMIDIESYNNLRELFKDDYSRYIAVSNVVFNRIGNKAVVCFGEFTSPLSGYSVIYFLNKINNIWKIVESKKLSIT